MMSWDVYLGVALEATYFLDVLGRPFILKHNQLVYNLITLLIRGRVLGREPMCRVSIRTSGWTKTEWHTVYEVGTG